MPRRLILFAALAIAAAPITQAFASAAAKAEGEAEQPMGQYVDLSSVGLPVVYEGRLVNYVFVTVRVNLANGVNAAAMREKEPYFRDALVRLGHRRPFTRLDDFTQVDEAALRAAFGPEATRIAGPRAVLNIQVTSQATKQRFGLPIPPKAPGKGAGAPPRAR